MMDFYNRYQDKNSVTILYQEANFFITRVDEVEIFLLSDKIAENVAETLSWVSRGK